MVVCYSAFPTGAHSTDFVEGHLLLGLVELSPEEVERERELYENLRQELAESGTRQLL